MPFDGAGAGTLPARPASFLDLLEHVTAGQPAQAAMFMAGRSYTRRKPKAPPPPMPILVGHVTIRSPRGDIAWREYAALPPDPKLFMDGGLTVRCKQRPPSDDPDFTDGEVSDEWAGAAAVEDRAELRGALLLGVAAALEGPSWLTLDLLWQWSAGLTPTAIVREGLAPLSCPKAVRAQLRAAADRFYQATKASPAPGAVAASRCRVEAETTPAWSRAARQRAAVAAAFRAQRLLLDARDAAEVRAKDRARSCNTSLHETARRSRPNSVPLHSSYKRGRTIDHSTLMVEPVVTPSFSHVNR